MAFVTGEIVSIRMNAMHATASVRVGGALVQVPLDLVPDAAVGDHVLIGDGVALTIVEEPLKGEA